MDLQVQDDTLSFVTKTEEQLAGIEEINNQTDRLDDLAKELGALIEAFKL